MTKKLVKKLVTGIGLNYKLFEAAGIVTPGALAELQVSHFGALGVENPDDRRKLFFLIQRIRQETAETSSNPSDEISEEGEEKHKPDALTVRQSRRRSRRLQEQQQQQQQSQHQPDNNSQSVDQLLDDVLDGANLTEVSQSFDENLLDDVLNDDDDDDDDNNDETQGPSDEDDGVEKEEPVRKTQPPAPEPRKNGRRTSLLQSPQTRRAVPKSHRTGKPLSSIHDGAELPMSPLMEAPPNRDRRGNNTTLTRTSSESSLQERSSTSSQQSYRQRTTHPKGSFPLQLEALRQKHHEPHIPYNNVNTDNNNDMRIRVVVRKRPASETDIMQTIARGTFGKIHVFCPKTRVDLTKDVDVQTFCFDNVFDETISNVELYEQAVRNIVPGLFEGESATVFCYGQTGSGKTHTMFGNDYHRGMYGLAALDIFHVLNDFDYYVSLSMFEIYSGKLYDLLNEKNVVKCLEDAAGDVQIPGLSEHTIQSTHELENCIEIASQYRSTGTTSRNAQSSRSHAILQLKLMNTDDTEFSRLTLMDLAGSERGSDAINKQTHVEGAEINTSLLALKEVIRALANNETNYHVPFRGSKLTQVLKQSFVSSKTIMIACVSPNLSNVECSLNTLRYADRIKERKVKPVVHHTPSDVLDDILGPSKGVDDTVSIHKDAVSVMLDMVQEEMKLVSDIGDFDEYLDKLYKLQDEQLEMIGLLKEQLAHYFPNESFEDLRD